MTFCSYLTSAPYDAFRLPSFCIGRRLPMLVFCVTTHFALTNIHNTLLWKSSIGRCRSMHSDEVWMHHYSAAIHWVRQLSSIYIQTTLNYVPCDCSDSPLFILHITAYFLAISGFNRMTVDDNKIIHHALEMLWKFVFAIHRAAATQLTWVSIYLVAVQDHGYE